MRPKIRVHLNTGQFSFGLSNRHVISWTIQIQEEIVSISKVSKIKTKNPDIGFLFRTDFRLSLESIRTNLWILDISTSQIWSFCPLIRWYSKSKLLFSNHMALGHSNARLVWCVYANPDFWVASLPRLRCLRSQTVVFWVDVLVMMD